MKNFFFLIPNKIKAVYVLWSYIHFMLWVFAGLTFRKDIHKFFLIKSYHGLINPKECYDLSELLFFTLTPVVIYYIIHLFRDKTKNEFSQNNTR